MSVINTYKRSFCDTSLTARELAPSFNPCYQIPAPSALASSSANSSYSMFSGALFPKMLISAKPF
jgi:hypothetical protein